MHILLVVDSAESVDLTIDLVYLQIWFLSVLSFRSFANVWIWCSSLPLFASVLSFAHCAAEFHVFARCAVVLGHASRLA